MPVLASGVVLDDDWVDGGAVDAVVVERLRLVLVVMVDDREVMGRRCVVHRRLARVWRQEEQIMAAIEREKSSS